MAGVLAGPSLDHVGSRVPLRAPATRRRSQGSLAFEVREPCVRERIVRALQASQLDFVFRWIARLRQREGSVKRCACERKR